MPSRGVSAPGAVTMTLLVLVGFATLLVGFVTPTLGLLASDTRMEARTLEDALAPTRGTAIRRDDGVKLRPFSGPTGVGWMTVSFKC